MKAKEDYVQRYKTQPFMTKTDYLVEEQRLQQVKDEERILLALCKVHARMKLCGKRIILANEIDRKLNKWILM